MDFMHVAIAAAIANAGVSGADPLGRITAFSHTKLSGAEYQRFIRFRVVKSAYIHILAHIHAYENLKHTHIHARCNICIFAVLAAILLTITCGAYFVLRELCAQIEPRRSSEALRWSC